mgnify:FL=1
MGALTGRLINQDITLMSISGTSVLALFTEASIEISVEEIDVSAAKDVWKQREFGQRDWRMTCTKLISGSSDFVDMVLSSQPVVVSTNIGGVSFTGTGIVTGVPLNAGDPQNEQITVVSAGGAPTIA